MARESWPPYRTVRDLLHRHAGRTAVIMGGGPSMPAAIARAPLDAIYVSVNDHGVRLLKRHPELNRRCSYIVACDKHEKRWRFDIGPGGDREPWNLPVVSRHMWADYRLLYMPAPSSGMAAAWAMRLMGCSPIIVTGMDLFAGATYFDQPKAHSSGKSTSEQEHLNRWRKFAATFPAMYRTIGCSRLLEDVLGRYDATEEPAQPVPVETLKGDIRGVFARILTHCELSTRPFSPPVTLEFCKAEVEKLVKLRYGRRVPAPG